MTLTEIIEQLEDHLLVAFDEVDDDDDLTCQMCIDTGEAYNCRTASTEAINQALVALNALKQTVPATVDVLGFFTRNRMPR